MDFRAPDPFDPGVADARFVEGSVDPGRDVLNIVWAELESDIVGELEGSLVYSCHRGGESFFLQTSALGLHWTTFHPLVMCVVCIVLCVCVVKGLSAIVLYSYS